MRTWTEMPAERVRVQSAPKRGDEKERRIPTVDAVRITTIKPLSADDLKRIVDWTRPRHQQWHRRASSLRKP